MGAIYRSGWAATVVAAGIFAGGCGLPGSPQPPSLNLPQKVTDLAAERAGDQVLMHWTVPLRNTDKTLIKGKVKVRMCRSDGTAPTCTTAGNLQLAPGAGGLFHETLPPALASGSPRKLTYFVESENSNGRSAGLSNGAIVLAGQAPADIAGLSAETAKDGVILRWDILPAAQEPGPTTVRLQRTLLTPAAAKQAKGPLTPEAEPTVQKLLVPAGSRPGVVLDKDIQFGEIYEYRAQRVETDNIDGHTFELPSALSLPIRIHAVNAFPPSVPGGLVAVATPAHDGMPPSIDLSWQPDAGMGIAGYIIYRRESGQQQWLRVSPAQPVIGPAFHDAHVAPGQTYQYAVSAVGFDGLESERSAEAQETVPNG